MDYEKSNFNSASYFYKTNNYQFCRSNIELNLLFRARLVCSTSFLSSLKGGWGRDLKLNSISKTHIPSNSSELFAGNPINYRHFSPDIGRNREWLSVQTNQVHISKNFLQLFQVLFSPSLYEAIKSDALSSQPKLLDFPSSSHFGGVISPLR